MPYMRAHVLAGDRSWVATSGTMGVTRPGMATLGCRVAEASVAGHHNGSVWPSPVATAMTRPFQGP
eukprot:4525822-Heterocapsa_arctica.AAC.1